MNLLGYITSILHENNLLQNVEDLYFGGSSPSLLDVKPSLLLYALHAAAQPGGSVPCPAWFSAP
ncbi:MAG: hypothetical protein A3F79_03015 [Chlamydiae bacterium RIFCSPLOWO2_12_FULL_45_20]|nr:MAG: hypothetical protein A3I67_04350 [Chlamydiae bacterium RIFCSPLOWO2_02_FULL_45_22]OGN71348.1 MAG: hypothetical protein A3F79_03015 [Chlamydiae bacterium RIFCSPLOWO2_12_FULL_45_20]